LVRRQRSLRARRPGCPDRQAVEVAESYADGVVGLRELAAARDGARSESRVVGNFATATNSDDTLAYERPVLIKHRTGEAVHAFLDVEMELSRSWSPSPYR
jgi:hypothetical protein